MYPICAYGSYYAATYYKPINQSQKSINIWIILYKGRGAALVCGSPHRPVGLEDMTTAMLATCTVRLVFDRLSITVKQKGFDRSVQKTNTKRTTTQMTTRAATSQLWRGEDTRRARAEYLGSGGVL